MPIISPLSFSRWQQPFTAVALGAVLKNAVRCKFVWKIFIFKPALHLTNVSRGTCGHSSDKHHIRAGTPSTIHCKAEPVGSSVLKTHRRPKDAHLTFATRKICSIYLSVLPMAAKTLVHSSTSCYFHRDLLR